MKLEKDGLEEIMYEGKIFKVVKQPMKFGDKKIMFETAVRSPGVRLIIVKDNQMLITKEFRGELDDYDYRLPGGKVFDTLKEYEKISGQDIMPFAMEAAKRECREETGLTIKNLKHFVTSKAGATIEWDLIYFIVEEFEDDKVGQDLEVGEVIKVEWLSFEKVKQLCKDGKIKEDRTLGILFKFFN